MNIINRRVSVLIALLVVLCFFGLNDIHSQKEELPRDKCMEQLHSKKGELVLFVSNELEKHAIHCVPPELPGMGDPDGTIIVDVLTDSDGNVMCVSGGKGNPVMSIFAEKAVRQWKFKPVMVNDKPVAFWGNVEVSVSWKRDKAAKQCSEINQRNK